VSDAEAEPETFDVDMDEGEIQHEELKKLAQSIEPSEVEKALETEAETEGEAPEGEGGEAEGEGQIYSFIGKFMDTALRAIAKRRGMSDEDIERYIALNEMEMDSANEALSPLLRKLFAKLGLAPDEIYALLAFIMIVGPRAIIIASYKPRNENVTVVPGKSAKEREMEERNESESSGRQHQ